MILEGLSVEAIEKRIISKESQLSSRYNVMKKAQINYVLFGGLLFGGLRTDDGYADKVELAKKELDEFREKYVEYLL